MKQNTWDFSQIFFAQFQILIGFEQAKTASLKGNSKFEAQEVSNNQFIFFWELFLRIFDFCYVDEALKKLLILHNLTEKLNFLTVLKWNKVSGYVAKQNFWPTSFRYCTLRQMIFFKLIVRNVEEKLEKYL